MKTILISLIALTITVVVEARIDLGGSPALRSSRTVATNKVDTITRLYADKTSNKHTMKITSPISLECSSFRNDDPVLSVRMYRDRTVCSPLGQFSVCNGSDCPSNP